VAGQCIGDERVAVAGRAGYALDLTGRREVAWSAAGDDRCLAHRESDPGPAFARALLGDWGGLTPEGHWKASRNGLLWPARVVRAVFRGKMLAAIHQAWAHGEVTPPEPLRPQQWRTLLHRLGHPTQTKWNVRLMERYRRGAGVVTYLARYLRGGPLKNARLIAWDGERVTCTCRARHEEADGGRRAPPRMTLAVADFLQRWWLPVPGPHTRTVRSYGLYQHAHAEARTPCRGVRGQPPVEPPTELDWHTVCAQRGDAHPEPCPTCGQRLVCPGVIPRSGAPPPRLVGERAA
jgi:Putative transposase